LKTRHLGAGHLGQNFALFFEKWCKAGLSIIAAGNYLFEFWGNHLQKTSYRPAMISKYRPASKNCHSKTEETILK
jgi:hypothetical protein